SLWAGEPRYHRQAEGHLRRPPRQGSSSSPAGATRFSDTHRAATVGEPLGRLELLPAAGQPSVSVDALPDELFVGGGRYEERGVQRPGRIDSGVQRILS